MASSFIISFGGDLDLFFLQFVILHTVDGLHRVLKLHGSGSDVVCHSVWVTINTSLIT